MLGNETDCTKVPNIQKKIISTLAGVKEKDLL